MVQRERLAGENTRKKEEGKLPPGLWLGVFLIIVLTAVFILLLVVVRWGDDKARRVVTPVGVFPSRDIPQHRAWDCQRLRCCDWIGANDRDSRRWGKGGKRTLIDGGHWGALHDLWKHWGSSCPYRRWRTRLAWQLIQVQLGNFELQLRGQYQLFYNEERRGSAPFFPL